jgi:acyl-coenzyme A thioesterase PaaI-like protein
MIPSSAIETPLSDPFEIHLGPVFETGERGARRFFLEIDSRHVNGRGVVHGATLMSFADLALGQAAWDVTDHASVVTLNMQSQFLKSAGIGDVVSVLPQLVRRTRSMLFLRGDFEVSGEVIFTASSIWKILGQSKPPDRS